MENWEKSYIFKLELQATSFQCLLGTLLIENCSKIDTYYQRESKNLSTYTPKYFSKGDGCMGFSILFLVDEK